MSASEAMLDLKRGHELAKLNESLQKQNVSNVSNVRLSPPKTQTSPPSQAGFVNTTHIWPAMPPQGQQMQQQMHQTIQGPPMPQLSQMSQPPQATQHQQMQQSQIQPPAPGAPQTPGSQKPIVGSDEWHKQRRENHKEVERRRRETINDGINELAKIVPGCEKNKGSILARAVQYIQQLKDNEAATIEKWTLEKLLTDQAINELSQQVEMLKSENERVRSDNDRLRMQMDELTGGPSKKKQRTDFEQKQG
ncbi:hypothetical protein BC937DRAFT_93159 [Endogone sp. FLAS-F59071]|nr:hypothetical protein BC937DRAFT_93159 [Endogone sp. FLAS-F59071]|eukprot:RUS14921.1 hypothetical protein BC937DRAFT_93159 [Endogone sp. FLAS-F59071]